jgi:two-component system, OmpR family, sensor histidine kinase SenX3
MFTRRRKSDVAPAPAGTSPLVIDLLNVIDAEYIVVSATDAVLEYSPGILSLGILREMRIGSQPILNLLRAVRRSRKYEEETLELPRGPLGSGTHDLLVRVAPIGSDGLLAILIFDDSEFTRLNSMRRDFVANISHELKTPIGALSILAEAVLEASDDPAAIKKFASRMQIEAVRLSELVQEVINLSRLQDEDPLKNAEILDLALIARSAIDECRLSADKRKIDIVIADETSCYVLGDKSQLHMAISNLIQNAINYSPQSTRVGVAVTSTDDLVEFTVSDQGVGIPDKDLERVFERFYRVDPARSRETGGTGLGLSIVKHVASNHGGDISVWSLEGQGSTFTLRLPRTKDLSSLSDESGR